MTIDYSKWPVRDFERAFFKEITVGAFGYLVPCQKLGHGQRMRADKARLDAARAIIEAKPELLAELRKEHSDSLARSISATEILVEQAQKRELREVYADALINLKSVPELPDGEATESDAEYYVRKHRADDELYSAWIAALYIPLVGSPPVSEIYPYIPTYVLVETQNFFGESLNEPEEKSSETPKDSSGENTSPATIAA